MWKHLYRPSMFAIPSHPQYEILVNRGGSLAMIIRGWMDCKYANALGEALKQTAPWAKKEVFVHGKWHNEARRTFSCGDRGIVHNYTGTKTLLLGWHPLIKPITDRIISETGIPFNAQLANEYNDGNDYISHHSDKGVDLSLPETGAVVTVTLGGSRDFIIKSKAQIDGEWVTIKRQLHNGDAMVMFGRMQADYTHGVPKRAHAEYRISLTFRCLRIQHRDDALRVAHVPVNEADIPAGMYAKPM